MSSRKRSGSGSKRPKEKVVYIYEMIFRVDFKDPTKTNPEFWHEFFLLSPNVECLENEITKLSCEQLIALKSNINLLFCRCIEMLDSGEFVLLILSLFPFVLIIFRSLLSDHPKRLCNSLQTICALFYAVFKWHATETSFDVISTIFDFDEVEDKMKTLITKCNNLMISDMAEIPRLMCLKLLLVRSNWRWKSNPTCVMPTNLLISLMQVLVTGCNNVSQNILLEYIMINSQLFDSCVRLLSDPTLRQLHGHDVVILLTLLVNYRKNESANPHIVQLSILADELALNGYASAIIFSLL